MNKWTIKQLDEMDYLLFTISILNERLNKLNPYTPLAEKLQQSVARLNKIRDLLQSDGNGHRELINSLLKVMANVKD